VRDLISVIVPTFQEAGQIEALLDHLQALPGTWEVIVVDGGSHDATLALARRHASAPTVLRCVGGRARQLNAGAALAIGDPIVFLHADSRLPAGAWAALRAAVAAGHSGGNFTLRFDGGDRFSRVLGAVYAAQRRMGYYYGDSTIWVTAATFERLRGYRELPIMDDYDFARRLEGLGATARLPGPATTSARRWRGQGIPRTVLSWVLIRWLYLAGVPPQRLAALYRRIR
jgi:rSAM/selenodomain-associated transferase 2